MRGATLARASLTGANLAKANMRGATLIRASLTGANMLGTNLAEANLTGANLEGAYLNGANLRGANLTGAIGIVCAGYDPRGYRFVGVRHDGEWTVAAGCRWFTIAEAKDHWANNRDALARVAVIEAQGN
jgi:uncharacterized protein YjbI with pentapeptide repeats